jgi:hypothetical protein
VASRSSIKGHQKTGEEIEELLVVLEKLLDRTKVMFEQYFMGIQKLPPSQLHRDLERKIRELTQEQIRNTALRFRFTTVSQKFGSYNTYWKRTLRKIEQGTYIRDVARVKRRAEAQGEDIPEEILVAMPKRMRDKILRDREVLAERVDVPAAKGKGRRQRPLDEDTQKDWEPPAVLDDGDERAPVAPMVTGEDVNPLLPDAASDLDEMFDRAFGSDVANSRDPFHSFAARQSTEPGVAPPAERSPGPRAAASEPPAARAAAPAPGLRAGTPPPTAGLRAGTPPPTAGLRAGTPPPGAIPPPVPAAPARMTARPAATMPTRPGTVSGTAPGPQPGRAPARPHSAAPESARPTQAVRPTHAPTTQSTRSTQKGTGAAPLPPGMSEPDSRELYRRYVQARKLVGENTDNLSYEKLMRTLSQQAPQIMREHRADGVDFNIVIKGNKVVLKAKPKTSK